MTYSMIVREKGIGDGYAVRRVIAFIRELGYQGKKFNGLEASRMSKDRSDQ